MESLILIWPDIVEWKNGELTCTVIRYSRVKLWYLHTLMHLYHAKRDHRSNYSMTIPKSRGRRKIVIQTMQQLKQKGAPIF